MFLKRLLAICMLLVTSLGMINSATRPAHPLQTAEAPQLPYAGDLLSALEHSLEAGHAEDALGIPTTDLSGSAYGYTATCLADTTNGSTWPALSNATPQAQPSESVKSPKPLLKKFVNGG